ncbi:MAG TPA: hypothetical protein ENJ95_19605 [Bacteroidetes bacterium]|nr:hypothetical protein [Bacteroidota bacterium]
MTERKIKTQWGILALIVFLVTLSRLVPYALGVEETFNFSPLAAVALFGGAYFMDKKKSFLFPLLALWISNLILDNVFLSQYYDGFVLFQNWGVYLAIAAIVGLAFFVLKKVTLLRVVGASLGASVLFFLVTNFVVWMQGTMYPMTFSGLGECFTAAIPFFRNTLMGDMVFSLLLFGAFEWAVKRYPKQLLQQA